MSKRKTIGNNPLDVLIPDLEVGKKQDQQDVALHNTLPTPETRVAKERLTIHLPVDLIDRLKNAVYWTPGLTLAKLGEEALTEKVNELENGQGNPFPPRREELKGGRPIK